MAKESARKPLRQARTRPIHQRIRQIGLARRRVAAGLRRLGLGPGQHMGQYTRPLSRVSGWRRGQVQTEIGYRLAVRRKYSPFFAFIG